MPPEGDAETAAQLTRDDWQTFLSPWPHHRERLWDYALSAELGIVPGTISFVPLGTYAIAPGSWPFVFSITTLAVLTVGGLVLARQHRHHGRHAATAPTNTTAETGPDGMNVDLAPGTRP